MFKIGIDARLINQTGVGVYLRNLLHFLEQINSDFIFYIYLLPEDKERINFKSKNFLKVPADFKWHSLSEQAGFFKRLYRDNLDLMHFTYFSFPVFYKRRYVSTIHDTTPLVFKTGRASTRNKLIYEIKHKIFKFIISQQVKNSVRIITPSYAVKKQIVGLYGKSIEAKITPIYEGVNFELEKIRNSKFEIRNSKKDKSFFIYIGNFYPHKNVENLINAFSKVKTDANLILIGPDDYFSKRLVQLINQLSQKKRIFFYHNPVKEELVYFYKNALALIHPSLSEGFGLPVIEAAYFNLPVIASNIEIFRELLGKDYISFDPGSIEDLAKKLELFLKSNREFDYKSKLNKFSFENMVKKTYEVYLDVLSDRR